jgi:GNAT superfamily N-acetyltransferase
MLEIRRYIKESDEDKLMEMIREEGSEWECYWGEHYSGKYRKALSDSITYVAYEDETIFGYSRSLDDCGFYIYVCDLLVRPDSRGQGIGRKLMECIYNDYPKSTVYVMSDVDGYYMKLDYNREGSVFEVKKPEGPARDAE